MKKPLIAFLMVTIAISLFASNVYALEIPATEYDYGAYGSAVSLAATHPSATTADSAWGESFRVRFDDSNLTKLTVYAYQAAATGTCTAYITAEDGTFGSSSVPTGAALATSDAVQITAGTPTAINFTFASGYVFDAAVDYCFYVAGTAGDVVTEYFGADLSVPLATAPNIGNAFYYDSGAWTFRADADLCFVIYATDGTAVAFSLGGDTYITDQSNLYNVTAGTADVALTVQSPPEDIMFYALLALTFACIILMLKSGIPLVNFVFGTMTLGIATYSLTNTDIIFFGYIQMFAILMATLCMLLGYRSYRND